MSLRYRIFFIGAEIFIAQASNRVQISQSLFLLFKSRFLSLLFITAVDCMESCMTLPVTVGWTSSVWDIRNVKEILIPSCDIFSCMFPDPEMLIFSILAALDVSFYWILEFHFSTYLYCSDTSVLTFSKRPDFPIFHLKSWFCPNILHSILIGPYLIVCNTLFHEIQSIFWIHLNLVEVNFSQKKPIYNAHTICGWISMSFFDLLNLY